jgi:capsular polysaccharide transport system permease protein
MRDVAFDPQNPGSRTLTANPVVAWLYSKRAFILTVIVPTLVVALYFGLIASNQYESEADFIVRATQESPAAASGLGQVFGLAGGVSPAQTESLSVDDYLSSHDAVAALRSGAQLVERYHRQDVDLFSRLGKADPTPEALLKYYRKHVQVQFSGDTGITTLKVRSFSPQDSFALINSLLKLGEQRVNDLNVRVYQDTLAVANRQLADAEAAVADSQRSMTGFRQTNQDIDPNGSSAAQIKLVSDLSANLSAARAQLSSMAASIRPDSPQYVALAGRVRAMEAQLASQSSHLAGAGSTKTIATDLGAYEALRLRQDFAAKRYASSAAALEQARDHAMKQQLFIVRVVNPNLPQKSTYPKRVTTIATVFFALLFAYAIGWLIVAGVKEHAA